MASRVQKHQSGDLTIRRSLARCCCSGELVLKNDIDQPANEVLLVVKILHGKRRFGKWQPKSKLSVTAVWIAIHFQMLAFELYVL